MCFLCIIPTPSLLGKNNYLYIYIIGRRDGWQTEAEFRFFITPGGLRGTRVG